MPYTRLPHRVVIQSETRTLFQGGAYTTSWSTASTEWANVQYDAGASEETYDNEKKQQMSIYNVIMRQDVTLTNKNRLLYNGNILVVEDEGDPTNRDRMKKIKCRLENT
jgi:head-tail adaptor